MGYKLKSKRQASMANIVHQVSTDSSARSGNSSGTRSKWSNLRRAVGSGDTGSSSGSSGSGGGGSKPTVPIRKTSGDRTNRAVKFQGSQPQSSGKLSVGDSQFFSPAAEDTAAGQIEPPLTVSDGSSRRGVGGAADGDASSVADASDIQLESGHGGES